MLWCFLEGGRSCEAALVPLNHSAVPKFSESTKPAERLDDRLIVELFPGSSEADSIAKKWLGEAPPEPLEPPGTVQKVRDKKTGT